ncbi:MAG: inositol monophosphatase family protein, partial [Candidatus Omnitrophota bacterium]
LKSVLGRYKGELNVLPDSVKAIITAATKQSAIEHFRAFGTQGVAEVAHAYTPSVVPVREDATPQTVPNKPLAVVDTESNLALASSASVVTQEDSNRVIGLTNNSQDSKTAWSVDKPAYIFLDADNFIWKGTFDLMPLIYTEIYWRIKNGIDVNQSIELSDEIIREGAAVFERMVPYSDAVALEKMMNEKGAQPVNAFDEYVALFNRLYQERYKQYVYLLPGVIEFLRAVADAEKQGHDIKLYMLSLGPGDFLGLNAEYLGIKDYFDGLIGPSWDVGESFDKAQKIIEIVGEDKNKAFIAMGGDSASDIEAGRKATGKGVRTFSFATPTGSHSREELKAAGVNLVIKSLAETETIFHAFGLKEIEIINHAITPDAKYIAFDFDDTVAHTEEMWFRYQTDIFSQVVLESGAFQDQSRAEEFIRTWLVECKGWVNERRMEEFARRIEQAGGKAQPHEYYEAKRQEKIKEQLEKMSKNPPLVLGIKNLLSALRGHKVGMGIVSGGAPEVNILQAQMYGLDAYFNQENIFGSPRAKKDILVDIKNKFHLADNELLMIGDAPYDMRQAKEAGVIAVGIAQDLASREALIAAGADIIIMSTYEGAAGILKTFGLMRAITEKSLELAKSLAITAGDICRKAREGKVAFALKDDKSLITKYDTEIEEMIVKTIFSAFPHHDIVAEENTLEKLGFKRNLNSDFVWLIDPIDGTRGFSLQDSLGRNDEFGTAIALLYKSKPLLSVFYAPLHDNGVLFYASELEDGAFMQTPRGIERINVNNVSDVSGQPAIIIDKSYRNPAWAPSVYLSQSVYQRLQKKFKSESLRPSSTFTMTQVAAGNTVLFIYPVPIKVWDLIPGAYIVAKAGGKVVNAEGKELFPIELDRMSGEPRLRDLIVIGSYPAVDFAINIINSQSINEQLSGERARATSPWLVGLDATSLPISDTTNMPYGKTWLPALRSFSEGGVEPSYKSHALKAEDILSQSIAIPSSARDAFVPVYLQRQGSLDTGIHGPPAAVVASSASSASGQNKSSSSAISAPTKTLDNERLEVGRATQYFDENGVKTFTNSSLKKLQEKFYGLSPDEQYRFTRGLLERIYGQAKKTAKKQRKRPIGPFPFVSINGPVTVDISIILQSGDKPGSFKIKKIFVTPGCTGPDAARVLAGHGAQTLVYGYGRGIEGRIFKEEIEEKRNIGFTDLLEGPSRAVIYLFAPNSKKSHVPIYQIELIPTRQQLNQKSGSRLLTYVKQQLSQVPSRNAFVFLGAPAFYRAPLGIIKQLVNEPKSKGYQVVVDFRPRLTQKEMRAAIEASPQVSKVNLEEFATLLGVELKQLLNRRGEPKFNEIAEEALKLVQNNGIETFIVSMGEQGAIAAYRVDQKQYQVIHVRAPRVNYQSALCAGDSLVAGFSWKRFQGANILEAIIYGVAAGAATTEKEGTGVVTNPAEIEAMVQRMEKQWGENLAINPLSGRRVIDSKSKGTVSSPAQSIEVEASRVNPVRELRSPTVLRDGGIEPPSASGYSPPTASVAFSNGVKIPFKIRAIFWDIDGVLLEMGGPRAVRWEPMAEELTRRGVSGVRITDLSNIILGPEETRQHLFRGEVSKEEFLEQINKNLSAYGLTERFASLGEYHKVMWATRKPNEKLIGLLEAAKKAGIIQGIITDRFPGDEQVMMGKVQQRFLHIFDKPGLIFASQKDKLDKHNPAFFERAFLALQREISDIKPQEVLFVDDSRKNCQVARSVGFQTVQYNEELPQIEHYPLLRQLLRVVKDTTFPSQLTSFSHELGLNPEVLVTHLLSSLTPSQLVVDIAEAGGRPTPDVVAELKQYNLLNHITADIKAIKPTQALATATPEEFSQMLSNIATQQKVSEERMLSIFTASLSPAEFIEGIAKIATRTPEEITAALAKYPALRLAATTY